MTLRLSLACVLLKGTVCFQPSPALQSAKTSTLSSLPFLSVHDLEFRVPLVLGS